MGQKERYLNRLCVDAVRESLGSKPLYSDEEEPERLPASPRLPTLATLAEKIQSREPSAVIELQPRKRGSLLLVFVNGVKVIHHNAKNRTTRDLLSAVEERWGRVWE